MPVALWRGGLAGLAMLVLAVGCGESADRKAARKAAEDQKAANVELAKVPNAVRSDALDPKNRDKRIEEALHAAQARLDDLLAEQPDRWSARAQLGTVQLQRGDFYALRVSEIIAGIRVDAGAAAQACSEWKARTRETARKEAARATATAVRDAMAKQRVEVEAEIATLRGKIKDIDEKATALRTAATAKSQQGQADKAKGDAVVAEAAKQKLTQEVLGKLADGYLQQIAANQLLGEAINLETQADNLVNDSARETAMKGIDQGATSAPDTAAGSAKLIAALRTVPDQKARLELEVLANQARLAAVTADEEDAKQTLAAIEKALTGGEDNLTKAAAQQRTRTMEELAKVAAGTKELDSASRLADEAYEQARTNLELAAKGAAAQAAEAAQRATAAGEAAPSDAIAELSVQLELSNAHANRSRLQSMLADTASLIDDLAATAADLQFDKPLVKIDGAKARDEAAKHLTAAVNIVQGAAAAAQRSELVSADKNIRESKLWTKALKDRREALERPSGASASPSATPDASPAPSPSATPAPSASPAVTPAPSGPPVPPTDPSPSPSPSPS